MAGDLLDTADAMVTSAASQYAEYNVEKTLESLDAWKATN